MNKKYLLVLTTLLLVGCKNNKTQIVSSYSHTTGGYFIDDSYEFPLHTVNTITMFDEDEINDISSSFDDIIINASKLLDRYHEYDGLNNLYTLNTNGSITNADSLLYDCIYKAYQLTIQTEGKYNLFCGNLTDLYKESLESLDSSKMPSINEIEEAIDLTPSYSEIDDIINFNNENKTITINNYKGIIPSISLGGIAKGYVSDLLNDYLSTLDYSLIYSLGSSTISTFKNNPKNSEGKYVIEFRLPNLDQSLEASCYIAIKDHYNISSSGDYENFYIYDNNKLMHHIINTNTGYSNNTFRSVSLVSNNCPSYILDALSTACFNCYSKNEAQQQINTLETIYNVSIEYMLLEPYKEETINYNKYIINYSKGFEDLMVNDINNKIIKGE